MKLNTMIDHTLLKPETTQEEIIKLCDEAKEFDFASVCIPPRFVSLAAKQLEGENPMVCTVIGFPLGYQTTAVKAYEAKAAAEEGADEVDMVIAIGALKEGDDAYVQEDIARVKESIGHKTLKVIIETCLLTKDEIKRACTLAVEAGADFVKTSTGFSTGGATVEDVRLMKETVGDKALVKASGGIRNRETAIQMVEAGASRLGASAGVAICREA